MLGVALQVLRQRIDEAGPELFQRIEGWFQKATGPEGRSPGLDFLLANFRELEGRYDELCTIYRELIERTDAPAGQRALACNNLAYFLAIEEEDVAGALALAERAIELAGPCPECLDTHGVALLAAGRADEAVAELRRVVGNDPTGLRLYHLAGLPRRWRRGIGPGSLGRGPPRARVELAANPVLRAGPVSRVCGTAREGAVN